MSENYAFDRVKKLVPILPSKNIPESLEFYQRVYGFHQPWAWTKSGQQITDFEKANPNDIGYGGLSEPLIVHFWFSEDEHVLESAGFRIEVEEIETIYAVCKAENCIHPNAPLETKPWGVKEFGTLDPSGVLVTIYQSPE
jgi:uncharacterized glyoxalase superfamily protein PhnB